MDKKLPSNNIEEELISMQKILGNAGGKKMRGTIDMTRSTSKLESQTEL